MNKTANIDWSNFGEKRDEWFPEPCRDPSHEFPGMMVVPPEGYTHTCPTCGKKTFRIPPRIYL